MISLKTRSELRGAHVHTTFFLGASGCTRANAGTLVTDLGEAQLLLTALTIGAERMAGHLLVEHEGFLSKEWAARIDNKERQSGS